MRKAKIMKKGYFRKLDNASAKWEEFAGKKNTENIVLRKASALARIMSSISANAVEVMQQTVISETETTIGDKHWWSVYCDFLLYMMHIADRDAFEYLKETKRKVFIDQLLKEVIQICLENFDDDLISNQFTLNFANNFMLFQKEFSSYERGETEYLTEDLTYMFAKRIQKRLGTDPDRIFNLQVFQFSIELELLLNIPDLLKDTKE
jgi:hypothetical protein